MPRRCATLCGIGDQAAVVQALGVALAPRVPVLLRGASGTGKTSVIRGMAGGAP